MANACHHERDLLVRVLVNYQLLAPYGEHWVYDSPLFGLCLEATRNTDNSQWGGVRTGSLRASAPPPVTAEHSALGPRERVSYRGDAGHTLGSTSSQH